MEHETEELRRFREQWKQEVESRLEHDSSTAQAPSTTRATSAVAVTNTAEKGASQRSNHAGTRFSAALDLYTQAVKLEADGNLDAATALYRKAFRIQEDIDKIYYRSNMSTDLRMGDLSRDIDALSLAQRAPVVKAVAKASSRTIQHILAAFPPLEQLVFERDEEIQPFYINRLPDELLIHVLRCFVHAADTRSVERFGAVSRKARVVTLDLSLWRDFVDLIYVPPQLNHPPEILLPFFQFDYRNMYINQPRVRLDGVYIAACHYVRKGHSENAWVNITHLITYYRYLRFLPNGIVLSLLSSDATATPQQIIPHLKLDSPAKGMQVGQWSLELPSDESEKPGVKDDEESEERGPVVIVDGLLDMGTGASSSTTSTTPATPKYSFRMRLGLRSKPTGRWNKLDILRYESIHLSTDEAVPLPLKHERPYWFSKVRSYGSGMG
ncbi:hypothetical protein M408DRAFT_197300 [Serendipita vermifera MAFF 305830]|uniref:F-box domain-containing protein n=1 Tax=Serendipita vermifera MAFF 305830 TaxID=933852 RepID=A0A0C2WIK5_SERVB|nr:hypothetical protein M408DRAFT_197300 [Serendipita vermifera MAFF 305830]